MSKSAEAIKAACRHWSREELLSSSFRRKPIKGHQVIPGRVAAAMNYRIDRLASGDNFLVLAVSGLLQEPALTTLREMLSKERSTMAMDLKEVTLVDREAVIFLVVSEAQGIELRNCPAYIREWINRESRTS